MVAELREREATAESMGRRGETESWPQRVDVEPEGQDFKVSIQMTTVELTGQETVVVPEGQGKETGQNQRGGRTSEGGGAWEFSGSFSPVTTKDFRESPGKCTWFARLINTLMWSSRERLFWVRRMSCTSVTG